jgi:hypothetical protein
LARRRLEKLLAGRRLVLLLLSRFWFFEFVGLLSGGQCDAVRNKQVKVK